MTLRLPTCLLALTLVSLFARPGPQVATAQDQAKVITNSLGMKLTLIPAGKFLMGSPATEADREEEEWQHEVVISKPFYLGIYEVTQQEYQTMIGKNPSFFSPDQGGGPNHPVEQVRWTEIMEFLKRLSERPEEKKAGRVYRLPTEAEWEYACRAGTTTPCHFGDSLAAKQANFKGTYPYGSKEKGPFLQRTTKVGSYPPNAWGLYDMHGNVWEWCADWYDPDYYKKSPKQDPPGPAQGVVKTGFTNRVKTGVEIDFYGVARGGCWLDEGWNCRSASRSRLQRALYYRLAGFRVACDVAGGK